MVGDLSSLLAMHKRHLKNQQNELVEKAVQMDELC